LLIWTLRAVDLLETDTNSSQSQYTIFLTYFILNVLAPMASESSWCPRQIPNTGFMLLWLTIFWMFFIAVSHVSGLPGPLLRNKPSYSEKWN